MDEALHNNNKNLLSKLQYIRTINQQEMWNRVYKKYNINKNKKNENENENENENHIETNYDFNIEEDYDNFYS